MFFCISKATMPAQRCPVCAKKVTLAQATMGKCRCGNTYCSQHRLPDDHCCTHNFKTKVLLEKIVAEKVIKI